MPPSDTERSGLQVLQGKPAELFPKVWKDWGITKLCFEVDTEPYAQKRDEDISQLASKAGEIRHKKVAAQALYLSYTLLASWRSRS